MGITKKQQQPIEGKWYWDLKFMITSVLQNLSCSCLIFPNGKGSLGNGYFDRLHNKFSNKFKKKNRKNLMDILLYL
jgi:hypothetical protein